MTRQKLFACVALLLSTYTYAPPLTIANTPTSAQTATQTNNLLTEIRDALSDDYSITDVPSFPLTWGFANTLAALDPNQGNSTGLAQYWSGASQYTQDTLSRIQFAQILVDIILTRGVISGSVPSSRIETYQQAYAAITNTQLDLNEADQRQILTDIKSISESSTYLPPELTNILVKIYNLKAATDSCAIYWDDEDSASSTLTAYLSTQTREPVFPSDSTSSSSSSSNNSSAPTPTSCDKVTCSISNRSNPYNGLNGIVAATGILKTNIESICGDASGNGGNPNFNGQPACLFVQRLLANRILDMPSLTGMNSSAGKNMIEQLGDSLDSLMAPIQTLILTSINNALDNTGRYPTTSFSSLYTAPPLTNPPAPSNCSSPPGSMPVPYLPNLTRCHIPPGNLPPALQNSQNNPALDSFVNTLVGMGGPSPIIPGPPLDIDFNGSYRSQSNNNNHLKVYIAGREITLSRVRMGSNHYWRSLTSEPVARTQKYLYIPDNEGTEALSLRNTIRSTFYAQRSGVQNLAEKSLSAKSSALDVINEIRNMGNVYQHYSSGSNGLTYSNTPSNILKESSQWRLRASPAGNTSSWLHNVAEMSNVSLLREIAVLLAETRQLQYLQLQTIQKQLLLQAVESSSDTATASSGSAQLELERDVQNYAAGFNPSPNSNTRIAAPAGSDGPSAQGLASMGAGAGQDFPMPELPS